MPADLDLDALERDINEGEAHPRQLLALLARLRSAEKERDEAREALAKHLNRSEDRCASDACTGDWERCYCDTCKARRETKRAESAEAERDAAQAEVVRLRATVEAAVSAGLSLEEAYETSHRQLHDYEEWGAEQWGRIQAARTALCAFSDALKGGDHG